MSNSFIKSMMTPRTTVDEKTKWAMRWRALYLLTAFGIFAADQLTKTWAIARLQFGSSVSIIPGFLKFIYAENPGVAFGQLQSGGGAGRWLLILFAVAAAVGVLIYFFRVNRTDDRVLGACALLLAGIGGNLADRVRLGYVVDFILIYAGSFHWPVFNLADMSICAGAALLVLDAFLDRGQKSNVREQ